MPASYTRKFIPHNRLHIPSRDLANSWPNPKSISNELQPPVPCSLCLLIGYDCPEALVMADAIKAKDNEPHSVKTELGWTGLENGPHNLQNKSMRLA